MFDMEKNLDIIDSYVGLKSNANSRQFIEVEKDKSVRDAYTKLDYYYFRSPESPEYDIKRIIMSSINAYNEVGIVKNVIDLMGDFASQGITIVHEDKKIQKFYRKWWKAVRGDEISERFLNNLYRIGNVVIKRSYARVRNKIDKNENSNELDIEKLKIKKSKIPYKYTFLNPMLLEVRGGLASAFLGNISLCMHLSSNVISEYKKPTNKDLYDKLPDYVKKAIETGKNKIDLNMDDICIFYYKKDDWEVWAKPMIHAILDDINMLEKLKLADLSALDGVISNIRLWTLGSLEFKILPNKAAIDKLRDILASNVGGGVMDLIWGPELNFKESNTQAYRFLGEEKYKPVLNSIYAGLGIPQTLTGSSTDVGYTNNFITLKTLIDRLEYGRSILNKFWEKEIELVQKVMGFAKPAKLHYDFMLASDENTLRNLWKELVDRNIISVETLRERINEDNEIEEARIRAEEKARKAGKMPPKSDPYHNANYQYEFIKTALNTGELNIKDIINDINPTGIRHKKLGNIPTKRLRKQPGRPKFSKDKLGRKQRTVYPKTSALYNLVMWANEAQKKISDILNEPLLNYYQKKNLRELSNAECLEMENIKFNVLSNLEVMSVFDEAKILDILKNLKPAKKSLLEKVNYLHKSFLSERGRQPTLEESKHLNSFAVALTFYDENDGNL